MARRLAAAAVLILLVGACGSEEPVAETGPLEITQIAFGAQVTITNNGAETVEIEGMWLCNRPSYLPLRGSLGPGEAITVDASGLGGLGQDGGEVGLYRSRNFNAAADMVDYVAWGTGGGRTDVAEDAGLFTDGDEIPNDSSRTTRGTDGSWTSG